MSKFLNDNLKSLEAYTPGEQPRDKKYIKLNTNESPYPPSPEVVAAVSSNEVADLRLYSDPLCKTLKEKIKIGATGFEPATSASRTQRSSQAELRPVKELTFNGHQKKELKLHNGKTFVSLNSRMLYSIF